MPKFPRVLIISHNPFSEKHSNGKTLSSFFKGWPKDKIAQLFLTFSGIDADICSNFFQISDSMVLKAFYHNNTKIGRILKEKDVERINKEANELGKNEKKLKANIFKKKTIFKWWARTILWKKMQVWKKKEVKEWIEEFNPDIIFFQTSDFYPIYDMVKYIKEQTKAKLYIETTDDYVTPSFSLNPLIIIKEKKMENAYRSLVNEAECVFAIGGKMAKEYQQRFGGNYRIAMNSIEINNKVKDYRGDMEQCIFTYAGNLGLNRWKILCNLGKTIEELNMINNMNNKLIICSLNQPSSKIMKEFNSINSIEYRGALNSEELIELRNHSDVLVHVESFDKKYKKITRLSISTKIPEYMLSKRCILAIGPKDVASIEYIESSNCGVVITDKNRNSWKEYIGKIIDDEELRKKYIKQAYNKAKENHRYDINKNKVQKELLKNANG